MDERGRALGVALLGSALQSGFEPGEEVRRVERRGLAGRLKRAPVAAVTSPPISARVFSSSGKRLPLLLGALAVSISHFFWSPEREGLHAYAQPALRPLRVGVFNRGAHREIRPAPETGRAEIQLSASSSPAPFGVRGSQRDSWPAPARCSHPAARGRDIFEVARTGQRHPRRTAHQNIQPIPGPPAGRSPSAAKVLCAAIKSAWLFSVSKSEA